MSAPEQAQALARAMRYPGCHGIVVRGGVQQPCEKPTVGIIDGRTHDEDYWPACAYHLHRYGAGRVVPLADLIAATLAPVLALADEWDECYEPAGETLANLLKPCRGANTNVCVAEGCHGESCLDRIREAAGGQS